MPDILKEARVGMALPEDSTIVTSEALPWSQSTTASRTRGSVLSG